MDRLDKLTFVTPRLRQAVEAWAADKRGATAVEFALVALPFFFLLFGLIETAVVFIMSTALEHGINEASRQIRTGSLQEQGLGQAAFRNAVCAELLTLLDCDDRLHIDVRVFNSFGSTTNQSPIDPDTGEIDTSQFQFQPGGADEVVVARVFYEWDLVTPILTRPLSNFGDGNQRLLESAIAFRNEPFGN